MSIESFAKIADFKKTIWDFYAKEGRSFEWRHADDPYKIFISEVMLQQTQTHRVAQKYPLFLAAFPTFEALAQSSLRDVLLAWQGLGYNRRGKFLHESAQVITNEYKGLLPNDPLLLEALPGIGPATARSITAFAFNKPTIFIETNIRSVFIYFFFAMQEAVSDKQILPLVEASVDHDNPREWYYALMDYGVMLKKQLINPSRKSAHYAVQSKFEGSDRQIRGMILRLLTKALEPLPEASLVLHIPRDPERIQKILQGLINEKIITRTTDGTGILIQGLCE